MTRTGHPVDNLTRIVIGISRMTIHNGPGLHTLVLFKGCPLSCLWCSTPEAQKHEPEIAVYQDKCIHCGLCIAACPLDAIDLTSESISIKRSLCNSCGRCAQTCYPEAIKLLGQSMTIKELLAEIRKDLIFFKYSHGGVTISGGEPLLYPDFTNALLQCLKKEGINIGIDTSGHVPQANIQQMLPYIDFFLWDIKHMDPEKHRELTGVSNKLILSNAQFVSQRNVPLYIRIPVIPGYNDSKKNIIDTCLFARSLSSVVEVNLLPLHHLGKARYISLGRTYPIENISLVPDGILQCMRQLVESYGLKCSVVV